MQKLTDSEFCYLRSTASASMGLTAVEQLLQPGLRKLLSNYQEQLQAESYVAAERYTEANACTTTLDCDLAGLP